MKYKSNRIEWIDIAKGIGMIFVILGHTAIPDNYLKFVLAFNMPLFFFLSGCTFKLKDNFFEFLKKKIKTLLIPYFVFSIITYLFWLVVERRILNDTGMSIFKPIIGMFYANNIDGYMIFDGVLWFIACLFITEILFFAIAKIAKKRINNIFNINNFCGYRIY